MTRLFCSKRAQTAIHPGNIRKALVQLCQTLAQPIPRQETPAILKILENPANPDSDNHASPQTHTAKRLPLPAVSDRITHAEGMRRLGPVPRRLPCGPELMTLNSSTALPGQMIFPPTAWQTTNFCCLHHQDHTCLFAHAGCHHSRSEASVNELSKSSPTVPTTTGGSMA